jgi:hypothetical protein
MQAVSEIHDGLNAQQRLLGEARTRMLPSRGNPPRKHTKNESVGQMRAHTHTHGLTNNHARSDASRLFGIVHSQQDAIGVRSQAANDHAPAPNDGSRKARVFGVNLGAHTELRPGHQLDLDDTDLGRQAGGLHVDGTDKRVAADYSITRAQAGDVAGLCQAQPDAIAIVAGTATDLRSQGSHPCQFLDTRWILGFG